MPCADELEAQAQRIGPEQRFQSMRALFGLALAASKWPIWVRYMMTTLLALGALWARRELGEYLPGYPFILFYPIIIVCGLLFGRGSGMLATALSALLAAYFLMPPINRLGPELLALGIFSAAGFLIAFLTEALHTMYANLTEQHAQVAAAAREREVLLRELSHRTRNDLASIASLLLLRAQALEEPAKQALKSAANRVTVLARVYRRLSLTGERVVVDSKEFICELCDEMRDSLVGERPIVVECRAESHQIGQEKAVALGLIINEMVTNALKHAFPDGRGGVVRVSFERRENRYRLTIADNGVGTSEAAGGTGMGQTLARGFAAQLGGQFGIERGSPGTTIVVTIPVFTNTEHQSVDRNRPASTGTQGQKERTQ